MKKITVAIIFLLMCLLFGTAVQAAQLKIGTARTDITPSKRVPLLGQFPLQLSQEVETPLTANVVALKSVGDTTSDCTIFVSCDLLQIPDDLLNAVREKVAVQDTSINGQKLVLNGTHTHTAPTLELVFPTLPKGDDIMPIEETIDFIARRIADAIVQAWQNRIPGKMTYGLDFAVVGWSRRVTYADGHSTMYGNTNDPNFRGLENMEDHDVGTLFFLDENDQLISVIVNVANPSQVVEGRSKVNADFWHPVREKLYKRFGENLVVLGWCSAAGDMAPRPMYRKAAVSRMNSLRNMEEMQEIARRLDQAVADTWEAVRNTKTSDIHLRHEVKELQLPMRKVTEQGYQAAKAECEKWDAQIKANPDKAPAEVAWMAPWWHGDVVKRYEAQQKDADVRFPTTIHVIRLGDTVVCTNQFEFFTDFGIQIKARSRATQTFVVQLVGNGTYLPTERAVRGGSYSAIIQSNPVGPEGGQVLVDETVKLINEVFGQ